MTVIGVNRVRSVGVGLAGQQVFGIVRKVDCMAAPIGPALHIAKAVIRVLRSAAARSGDPGEVEVAVVGETGGVAFASGQGLRPVVHRRPHAQLVVQWVQQ